MTFKALIIVGVTIGVVSFFGLRKLINQNYDVSNQLHE